MTPTKPVRPLPVPPARPTAAPNSSRPLITGGQDFTKGVEVTEVSASQFADLFPSPSAPDQE